MTRAQEHRCLLFALASTCPAARGRPPARASGESRGASRPARAPLPAHLQMSLFLRDCPSSAKWLPKCTSEKTCRQEGEESRLMVLSGAGAGHGCRERRDSCAGAQKATRVRGGTNAWSAGQELGRTQRKGAPQHAPPACVAAAAAACCRQPRSRRARRPNTRPTGSGARQQGAARAAKRGSRKKRRRASGKCCSSHSRVGS